jgi:predicted nucleic acid-binding protein
MTEVAYLDASAIVKLVLDEPDSLSLLRWYQESERIVTSRVGVIETRRAASRRDGDPVRLAAVIDRLEVFELDADVGMRASAIAPPALRTLDAIHMATALSIPGLSSFVTYDDRLADAARAVGLPVVRPA